MSIKYYKFGRKSETLNGIERNITDFSLQYPIMNIRLFLTLILTISGCSYQIIDISNRYFSYKTKEFASFKIVQEIHLPATSVCWIFDDTVNQIKEWKNKSKEKLSVMDRMYQLLKTFTIADIFNSTPSIEEILAMNPDCAVRLPKELAWRKPWYNRTECQSMITIEKYVHRLTLCYKFQFRKDIGRSHLFHNSLSPSKPGFMYMLFLNSDIFSNNSLYTAYGHTQTSSPLFDSIFSYEKVIRTNGKPFRIGIVPTPMTTIALPKPYDTQCRSVPGYKTGTEYFLHRLNNETMREMNHVHSLGHIHIPYPYPLLTPNSLRNKTISDQFLLLYDRYKKFGYLSCYFKYNVPVTRLEEDERITIAVNWAQDNELLKAAIPDQMIIDFIIYVCSSIGIWLGLSAFSAMGMIFDVCGRKKSNEVDDRGNARAKNNCGRSVDSKLRDIQLITSGNSQALCNLIMVINQQKNLIRSQAIQIKGHKKLMQNLASQIRMIKEQN